MIHYKPKPRVFKNDVCNTFSHIGDNGYPVYKDKVKYDSQDAAITECKRINGLPGTTRKVVPYKCTVCHKYHIGRNGNLVKRLK